MTDSKQTADTRTNRPWLNGVRAWARSVEPDRKDLPKDVAAGLPRAISSVPDGMATAVLIGVNPVYGLYASFAGPTAGGLAPAHG